MRYRDMFWVAGLLGVACLGFSGWAGEIVRDEGGVRVVTGDAVVRCARGLEEAPLVADVSAAFVARALEAVCGKDAPGWVAEALASGLRAWGWAQVESEPGQETLKLRASVLPGPPAFLRIERLDIEQGVTAIVEAALSGGEPVLKRIAAREILDRSVYRGLLSPEDFVLNQEHFEKQFFEGMLDLSYPGLESVRAAFEAAKPMLALYELAEYYRRKTAPAALIKKPPAQPESFEDAAAEAVCKHLYTHGGVTIDLGPVIDWTHNKTNDAEWLWSLNRHTAFAALAAGYAKTGNPKYVDEFCAEMTDWVIQNPAPPYTLTRVAAWRNLEVGHRCSGSWPAAFYGFLGSPRFTPQAMQLMLGSLWSHGVYLLEHPAGLRKPNNWSVVDSTGLAAVGTYFPELRGAAEWRDAGYERLSRQLAMQVYPDGFQYELAPAYHLFCLRNFDTAYVLACENGYALPQEFSRQLESMYDALLWIMKPDRCAPAVSDTHPLPLEKTFIEGAERFGREDLRWVATGGTEGRPPAGVSHVLPYAGYFAMRSDWSRDALYLFFDGGPLGVSHYHEDDLSFELSAYGRNFIVDHGPHHYTPDQWRNFFVSSASHSTILIDGLGQRREKSGDAFEASKEPAVSWRSDDRFDVARAVYDSGYGPEGLPVVHARTIVFRKPGGEAHSPLDNGYWIILDELEGSGEHLVESLFQFAPDVALRRDGPLSIATDMETGANLRLAMALREGLEMEIVSGRETPSIQGWHSAGYDTLQPSPTVVCRVTCALPVRLLYVLFPVASGRPPDVAPAFTENAGEVFVQCDSGAAERLCILVENREGEVT